MICKYSYLTRDNKVVGDYQTDTEDLKKLIKQLLKEKNIRSMVIDLQNEEKWIGYMHFGNFRLECANKKKDAWLVYIPKYTNKLTFSCPDKNKAKREKLTKQLILEFGSGKLSDAEA